MVDGLIECINQCEIIVLFELIAGVPYTLILLFGSLFHLFHLTLEDVRFLIGDLVIEGVENIDRNNSIVSGQVLEVRKDQFSVVLVLVHDSV